MYNSLRPFSYREVYLPAQVWSFVARIFFLQLWKKKNIEEKNTSYKIPKTLSIIVTKKLTPIFQIRK